MCIFLVKVGFLFKLVCVSTSCNITAGSIATAVVAGRENARESERERCEVLTHMYTRKHMNTFHINNIRFLHPFQSNK